MMITPPNSILPTRYRENTVAPSDRRRLLQIEESLVNVWDAVQKRPKSWRASSQPSTPKSEKLRDKRALRKSDGGSPKLNRVSQIFSRTKNATQVVSRSSESEIQTILPQYEAAFYEAKKQIDKIYDELATQIVKNALSLPEKKKRIAIFIGGLCKIIDANVCHGDIRPENILWDDESFRISDFIGAIPIDHVCRAMRPEFRLENEDEKSAVRGLVQQLCDAKPIHLQDQARIQKLIDWKILTPDALQGNFSIINEGALHTLREYFATTFIPLHTEGFASEYYLAAMFHYFWRCQEEDFKAVCHAFDMRAAALTIYAILTGTRPPQNENDKAYYIQLEQSLKALGLSDWAASLVRNMAEPPVQELDKRFTVAVTRSELDQLKNEFYAEQKVQQENPEVAEDRRKLQLVQQAIARLQITVQGSNDDLMGNLINAVSEEKLLQNGKITSTVRKKAIETAFKNHLNNAYEVTTDLEGRKYTTVMLLDPDERHTCDVLIKENKEGDGATTTVYKALSLRTLEYVAIKYFQESVAPQELRKSGTILTRVGEHDGVQKKGKTYKLGSDENSRMVEIEPFLEKRDYGPAVFGDSLCSKWNIAKENESVREALQQLDSRLRSECTGHLPIQDRKNSVKKFIDEYAKSFTGIIGEAKTRQLINCYNVLVELANVEQQGLKETRK